jgi:leader peptidase (prepilin peptidase)/N-methyltransferase
VGSFLGLVAIRRTAGEQVVSGRSRCRACGRTLRIRDLVPVVSWLVLRGRCRDCGAPIPILHPTVEVAAVVVAVWAALVAPGWIAWAGAAMGWALILLAVIDLREYLLPDAVTLPLIAAGLALSFVGLGAPLEHGIGAVAGFVLFAAIGWAWERASGREALGLGDAKLFAAAGAWVGWMGLPSVMLLAGVLGLAFGLIRHFVTHAGLRQPMPFGPALAAGMWLTWAYGPLSIAWR